MKRASMSHLSVAKNDRVLHEGPHSRTTEFWLVLRALRDFIEGFRTRHFVGPCVMIVDAEGRIRSTGRGLRTE